MDDPNPTPPNGHQVIESPFDNLIQGAKSDPVSIFSVGFRGYDRAEVDEAIADLKARLKQVQENLAAVEHSKQESVGRFRAEIERLAVDSQSIDDIKADLAARTMQLAEAETRIVALTDELVARPVDKDADLNAPSTRDQFEAVLRVAEEQANVVLQNAAVQAERLIQAARDEVAGQRAAVQADAARILDEAQHDAGQIRLKIETEQTAHEATLQRETAHAAEKVAQAEREAEAIRTEADKGAAALRAMVTRETTQLRADTERDVREMNARLLEFEETLTRRQDDAQQEFLVLHNKAVAHAERITADANDQVAGSLEHAQLISAKAEDYEKLMRAQAAQIQAEAHVQAQETLERARAKANKIVTSVTEHTNTVLRDAEDRARNLRWQQQKLTSFMAEVRELIRPGGVFTGTPDDQRIVSGDFASDDLASGGISEDGVIGDDVESATDPEQA